MEKQIKKKTFKPSHKLFIKVRDKERPEEIDEFGRKIVYVKWKEVKQVNLGSVQKPNKEIFDIKYTPIEYEEDKKHKNPFFMFPDN